jgi:hypothetical protein
MTHIVEGVYKLKLNVIRALRAELGTVGYTQKLGIRGSHGVTMT